MIHAIKHIRPMRGGSQAHMLADENGRYWIVKFLNNPQHPRVLANEWIASGLARAVGLTVPDFDIMDVTAGLIESSEALVLRCGGKQVKPAPGPAFASRLPTNDPAAPVYDYLPESALETIVNQGRNCQRSRPILAAPYGIELGTPSWTTAPSAPPLTISPSSTKSGPGCR